MNIYKKSLLLIVLLFAVGWTNAQTASFMFSLATEPQDGGKVLVELYYEIETPFAPEEPLEEQDGSFVAVANEGWRFAYWTVNDEVVSVNNVYNLHLSEDTELVAHFEPCEEEPDPDPNLLSGRFSINGCTTVGFAKGNVIAQIQIDTIIFDANNHIPMATSASWQFAETQYYRQEYDADAIAENGIGDLLPEGMDLVWDVYRSLGLVDVGCWHVMTGNEWNYLLNGRPTEIRFAFATVNGVAGLLVLPDNWEASTYELNAPNVPAAYETNAISLSDWENTLEPAGALFLPANGMLMRPPTAQGQQCFYQIDLGDGSLIGVYGDLVFCTNEMIGIMDGQSTPLWGLEMAEMGAFSSMRLAQIMEQSTSTVTVAMEEPQLEYGTVSGGGDFACGASCTVNAIGNDGYVFQYWLEGDEVVSVDAEYTFVVDRDRDLVAVFVEENTVCPVQFELVSDERYSGLLGWCGESLQLSFDDGTPSILLTIPAPELDWNTIIIGELSGEGAGPSSLNLPQARTCVLPVPRGTTVELSWVSPNSLFAQILMQQMSIANTFSVSYESGEPIVEDAGSGDLPITFQCICEDVILSVDPDEGGYVVTDGLLIVGETVTLTAVANEGYTFVNWTFNGEAVSAEAIYDFEVTQAGEMVAHFQLNTYEIAVTASPAEGGTITGGGTYSHGATCVLTASPNTGYVFDAWTENGVIVSTEAVYGFIVTEARSLVAVFLAEYTVTATASPDEGGSVSGEGLFVEGETCTLTATANTGYTFVNWTENGEEVSTETEYSFTVTTDRNLVANFGLDIFEITAVSDPETAGTVTGAGTYNYGNTCTLTATPDETHVFVSWIENGEVVSTNAEYQFVVTEAHVLVAHFASRIDATALPSEGGSVAGSGIYDDGNTCTLTATVNTGYTFVNWTENGEEVATEAEYAFTVAGNRSLLAHFQLHTYEITATASPAEGGTITGCGTYGHGTTCVLTISPNTDFVFVAWTENGEIVSTDATYTFTVTEGHNLVAVMTQYTVTATANPDEGGLVSFDMASNLVFDFEDGTMPVSWNNTVSSYPWRIWSANPHGGTYCMASGNYNINSSESFVEATAVFAEGDSIDFYSRVSSESASYDYGRFFIDGTQMLNEGGTSPNSWTAQHYDVTAGSHTFRWYYRKDSSVNDGEDRYYIDDITFTGVVDVETDSRMFLSGETCTLLAIPNVGYSFFNWTENGQEVSTEVAYSFVVTEDRDLVANFSLNHYEVTVSLNPETAGIVTGAGNYDHGTTCTLTAEPNEGYVFISWTDQHGEVVAYESTYEFTVEGDAQYTASFEALPNGVYVGTGGGARNNTLPTNSYYDYTISQQIYTPSEIGGALEMVNLSFYNEGGENTRIFDIYMVHTDMAEIDLEAVGEDYTGWVDLTENDLVYSGSVTMKNGCWNTICLDTPFAYDGSSNLAIVVNDKTGSSSSYSSRMACRVYNSNGVQAIFDYGSTSYDPLNPPQSWYYFTTPIKNQLIFNRSGEYYTVSAVAHPIDAGTITGAGTYLANEEVQLEAIPAEGYAFRYWTENGEVVANEAIYAFTVTDNRSLVAHFAPNTQAYSLQPGWNWLSTYIEQEGSDGLTMLEEGLNPNGLIIKSQRDGFVMYDAGMWIGILDAITNEKGYMVCTMESTEFTLTGTPADLSVHPITLNTNWTWIGYPSSVAMDISEALADLNASNNDVLKSKSAYAVYNRNRWIGSLNTLNPGEGLMYQSHNSQAITFTYPNGTSRSLKPNLTAENNHWVPNIHAYPNNMNIIAVVELDGKELQEEHYELAVFSGDECRGSIRLVYVESMNRYVAFLSVAGEETTELSLALYDTETGKVYFNTTDGLSFETNAVLGSCTSPYVAHFGGATGMDEEDGKAVRLYPTPVAAGQQFYMELPAACDGVRVSLINALGATVSTTDIDAKPATLRAPTVPGVYTVRVVMGKEGTCSRKLIVK